MADFPSSSPSSLSDGESESSQTDWDYPFVTSSAFTDSSTNLTTEKSHEKTEDEEDCGADSDSSGDCSSASSGPSPSHSSLSDGESESSQTDWDSSCDRTARISAAAAAAATSAQQPAAPPGFPAVPPRPAARAAQPALYLDALTIPGFGQTIIQAVNAGRMRPDDVDQMFVAYRAVVRASARARLATRIDAATQAARQESMVAAADALRMARAIIRASVPAADAQADSGDSSSASSGPSPSPSSLSDGESESSQTDWDYPFVTSSAFTDSSTNLTTDNSHEKTEDEGDCSSASSDSSTNETTEKNPHFYRLLRLLCDDKDATPKSEKVIITDFISTDLKKLNTDCGPFTKIRETAQKRVHNWNCACDLFPVLLNIEGSPEKDGIGLAIVSCHGKMKGDEQFLLISKKSKCKRCVSPIPLSKVMAALNSTKKNLSCALLACRIQDGPESEDDSSFDVSSLVTPYVSLVLPCGRGSVHWPSIFVDEMRQLLLKKLGECKPVREALDSLHGKFFCKMSRDSGRFEMKNANETPIEVIMHKDWMRHEETNEDGLALQESPIIEELPPHEKLGTLFAKYKDNKSSNEERCRALKELRFLIAFNWDEITAIYSKDPMTPFLKDILEALNNESNGKMIKRLVEVVVEATMKSIHRTTGFQTWRGIVGFIENCLSTSSVSLKMNALSILVKVPNLFGKDSKSPLSIMKNCLIDTNPDIQSLALEWISYFLQIKETWDLSPLIPILVKRAEERMIIAEKENEIYLIVSLVFLTIRFPDSFPPQSVISIVKKGLQSSMSDELKEVLICLPLPLMNKDPNGETAWATELDQESMANLVVILQYCVSSTNTDLKRRALFIHCEIPGALASDPIAAADFFEKLLNDSDKNTRILTFTALFFYYKKVDKEGELTIQSALVPLVPTIIERAEERMTMANEERDIDLIASLILLNDRIPDLLPRKSVLSIVKKGLQSTASDRLKMCLLAFFLDDDFNGKEVSWASELDQESMENIVVVLRYCVSSTNTDLKRRAILFNSMIPGALATDPSAAADIFKKLLDDADKTTRILALTALCAYYIKVDEEGELKIQSALVPLVPKIIELGMDPNDERAIHVLSALAKYSTFFQTMMAQGHIEAALKCCMQVDIEPLISDDYRDHLDSECLERLQNALKTSDILKPLSDITHTLLQSDKWREQCNGLHGLIAIAKHGNGSMVDYIEKISPLLKDTNPLVRILACLALENISSHSESDFTNRTHKMIIPALISALSDEIPKVVARVASTLRSMVIKEQSDKPMPKEILIQYADPLIDATLECAQKWKEHMGKKDFPHIQWIQYPMIEILFFSMKVAEESIASHYEQLISLLKNGLENYLNADIILLKTFPEFLECILNCISFIGSVVEKGKFINDVKEVMYLLVGKSSRFKWYAGLAFDGFARWCAIIGSDFAPLLVIVIDVVVKWASALPCKQRCPCEEHNPCDYDPSWRGIVDGMRVPSGRDNADTALTTFAKILGVDFTPHVDDVFKAAQQHLMFPSFDKNCWSADIFPLLLACLESQGVGAKRVLWTKFWPALQKASKEVNLNKYSAKAIKSITRSIEQLGLKGINELEREEVRKWIENELDAVEKRRLERQEENDDEAIDAIKEVIKIGESILGFSFCINDQPLAELIGDNGVEESNLSLLTIE